MKIKIISLLAVVALVVVMAVPALAVEYDKQEILQIGNVALQKLIDDGEWDSDSYFTFCDAYVDGYALFMIVGSSQPYFISQHYEDGYSEVKDRVKFPVYDDEFIFMYTLDLEHQEWDVMYDSDEPQLIDYDLIQWTSYNLYDVNGNLIREANKSNSELFCDGSTCPATDVNQDNVCDDCGMTFAVLRDYGPSFPDPYTVWTDEYQERFPYAFIYSESGIDYLVLAALRPDYENGEIRVDKMSGDLSYLLYAANPSGLWKYQGGYSEGAFLAHEGDIYPSFDLLQWSDGSVVYPHNKDFFPIPLWVEMGQVTQGEMGQLTQTTAGTITTLILCGVGLMVLLVVLSLFGKRSLIYRN